jgi:uncharacterized protein (TIGR02147 family)
MEKNVFEFSDYRAFLLSRIHLGRRARRGALSSLARAMGCQVSYLSRVLKNGADLSLEQADLASRYFGLSPEEDEYFLLLVQHARAGTRSLREKMEKRLRDVETQRLDLQKRVGVKEGLNERDQARYYSHWYYAAVHVLTGIPALQTREAMARVLHLPMLKISEIVEFLKSAGLVREESGKILTGLGKIHLRKDSDMILQHHSNWRYQAIQAMERDLSQGLHYSVLVNVSKVDLEKLKTHLARFIEEFMKVVHPSADEVSRCLTIDFFSLFADSPHGY